MEQAPDDDAQTHDDRAHEGKRRDDDGRVYAIREKLSAHARLHGGGRDVVA